MKKTLFSEIKKYSGSDIYPFHMPGHKRRFDEVPYLKYDITELPGFDNLNNPEGLLFDMQERLSALYGSQKSFICTNGATEGILSAILGSLPQGGLLGVASNCHKSVVSGLVLSGAYPIFIEPCYIPEPGIYGGVVPEAVEAALREHPSIRAMIIVSPTYDGIISDIRTIAGICHAHDIPLIVDEAHGAHLSLGKDFPRGALAEGADIVIHGLHKTLPFATQTGAVHINSVLCEPKAIERALSLLRSSSPSYLLMAAADEALSLLETKREKLFDKYFKRLVWFREKAGELQNIEINDPAFCGSFGIFAKDPGKLLIYGKEKRISGIYLKAFLTSQKTEPEYAGLAHVLAMSSVMDEKQGFKRLLSALKELDKALSEKDFYSPPVLPAPQKRDIAVTTKTAFYSSSKSVPLFAAEGKIAAESVIPYPPGVPVLIPGQNVTRAEIELINTYYREKVELIGFFDKRVKILV
ncbi:MAG: aminotransferase class I/II-fold pyridoxal phosphate-dependent enzyme [Firmicutes bacterium]|nr:aminotransferase class I/II-fold pyridoxal phosphate-dependent enzyme [Bacillota bacterium]